MTKVSDITELLQRRAGALSASPASIATIEKRSRQRRRQRRGMVAGPAVVAGVGFGAVALTPRADGTSELGTRSSLPDEASAAPSDAPAETPHGDQIRLGLDIPGVVSAVGTRLRPDAESVVAGDRDLATMVRYELDSGVSIIVAVVGEDVPVTEGTGPVTVSSRTVRGAAAEVWTSTIAPDLTEVRWREGGDSASVFIHGGPPAGPALDALVDEVVGGLVELDDATFEDLVTPG